MPVEVEFPFCITAPAKWPSRFLVSLACLMGVAAVVQAETAITLAANRNPATLGSSVTFTANLAGTSPTGTVQFIASDFFATPTVLCNAAAVANAGASGSATCSTAALPAGDYSVVAHYSGDGDDAPASSAALTFWVATACRNAVTPSQTMPGVTFLRSYYAGFGKPARITADLTGNVLVADETTTEVVVRAETGTVTTRISEIGRPVSVAAGSGLYYVGDAATGRVSAYDASWVRRFDFGAGSGEFGHPGDMVVDTGGGEVFVTDTDRHVVKVYDAANGSLRRTLGRYGRADAQFHTPTGIAIAGDELLVADQMNYRVQALDKASGAFRYCLGTYSQSGFFSGVGGPGRTYGMTQGLTVDASGRLYVVDAFQGVVRLVDRSNGALIGSIGSFGQAAGQLRVPTDLLIDRNNRLFVSSANNARLDVWGLDTYSDLESDAYATVTLDPARLDRLSPPAVAHVILEIPGHALAGVSGVTVNGLTPMASVPGDADLDGQADLLLDLDPLALVSTLGGATSGLVSVTGQVNGLNFVAEAMLTVTAEPLTTTTTLGAAPNPAVAGSAVTLTAAVSGLSPTGAVSFRNGSTLLCTSVPLVGGQADCVAALPAGYHSLTAEYAGDTDDAGSLSSPFGLSVNAAAPALVLISSDPVANAGQTVTFTATLTGVGPRGLVSFFNGSEPLCEGVELVPLGQDSASASCSTDALGVSVHSITVIYLGDASNLQADSAPFGQLVLAPGLSSVTAASPTGSGQITAQISGSCGFASYQFLSVAQAGVPPPPADVLPHGLFDFTTTLACTPGETVTLTITYPHPLPPGTQYWKYGPTPGQPAPHWYVLPASINGNVATFSITDGGLGDDDRIANGQIVDLGGPGASGRAIPAAGTVTLLLLALSLVAVSWWITRRRRGEVTRCLENGG